MFDLALLNGTIVPSGGRHQADIGMQDGIIAAISIDLSGAPAKETIDLAGHFILPGWIDAHQHLWETGMLAGPDFRDGTRTSLAGGVTTIVDQSLSPSD